MLARKNRTLVGMPTIVHLQKAPSSRLGRFVVHECLGVGGSAMVHRATTIGARQIALKRLLPALARDRSAIRELTREAKLALQLEHPSIVKTFQSGQIENTHYIAMELVCGRTLEAFANEALDVGTLVPIDLVVSLLIQLCDAVEYACLTHGLVHRDISPCNLMITDTGRLKLIDFGIARAPGAPLDELPRGKPRYMAPEALTEPGQLDTRADVFSIGVIAWELLTGRPLFDGDTTSARRPSDVAPGRPADLDDIVLGALQHHRHARWQSAGAMGDALERVRRARRTSRLDTLWPRLRAPARLR